MVAGIVSEGMAQVMDDWDHPSIALSVVAAILLVALVGRKR